MKNRQLTLTFALGLASCLGLAAQTAPAPASRAQHAANPAREAKRLGKELGLSSDQVAQLQPILADRAQQRAALVGDTTLTPKDRHAKMASLRQDTDAKIKAVLTADQQAKYVQLQQQRMAQHRPQQKS
jgi:Spy/CpxP family protein refolding chaperone